MMNDLRQIPVRANQIKLATYHLETLQRIITNFGLEDSQSQDEINHLLAYFSGLLEYKRLSTGDFYGTFLEQHTPICHCSGSN